MFLSVESRTTMDLSLIQKNQEVMGVERFGNQYGSHMFDLRDTFTETDVKGNNNLFQAFKTENNDHGHDPGSLFQDDYADEKRSGMENSPLSYSPFKKAIDLRIHNRTTDGARRTIFEDADYFTKNFCYKLLPITFESVDESIIHTEHNYSLFSLCSESEAEEDCSRTMDYSQIKEKNYKRRRTKFREGSEDSDWGEDGGGNTESSSSASVPERQETEPSSQLENSFAVQPLDLSSALVQDEKTDGHPREHPTSIVNSEEKEEGEEDKENVKANLGCIQVTITRPDEKENYEPCDLFLNDIARLVPRLIEKDCSEIDILDRTCGRRHFDIETHRLYYIIAESTWQLFQSTNERIILTNDQSLGKPVQRRERVARPTFLVFDQVSLARCLADYCQEIGGCFEYTFLDASREKEERPDEEKVTEVEEMRDEEREEAKAEKEQVMEKGEEAKDEKREGNEMEKMREICEEEKEEVKEESKETMEDREKEEVKGNRESVEKDKVEGDGEKSNELTREDKNDVIKEEEVQSEVAKDVCEGLPLEQTTGGEASVSSEEPLRVNTKSGETSKLETPNQETKKNRSKKLKTDLTPRQTQRKTERKDAKVPGERKPSSAPSRRSNPDPSPRIRTRSQSTSDPEAANGGKTSQSSDKPRKGRSKPEERMLSKEDVPQKRRRVSAREELTQRRTRSGKSLEAVDQRKSAEKDRSQKAAVKSQEEEAMTARLRPRKESPGGEESRRKLPQKRSKRR